MNIFIVVNQKAQGPYIVKQAAEMVRAGQLLMTNLAWHEGMRAWSPIHEISVLVETILPPMPNSCPTDKGEILVAQMSPKQPSQKSTTAPSQKEKLASIEAAPASCSARDPHGNAKDSGLSAKDDGQTWEESNERRIVLEGTKKIFHGVGFIILAIFILIFMILISRYDENQADGLGDLPRDNGHLLSLPHNLVGGHILEANLGSALEEQLPALIRGFRMNHSVGWIVVICLVVIGIFKIIEGCKIIASAKTRR